MLPLSSLNEYSSTTDKEFEIFLNAILIELWIKEAIDCNALTKANRQKYATSVWSCQRLTHSVQELARFCSSMMFHVHVQTTSEKKKEAWSAVSLS